MSKDGHPFTSPGLHTKNSTEHFHLPWLPLYSLAPPLRGTEEQPCPELLALTTPSALLFASILPYSPAFEMLSASQTAELPVDHDGQARAERFALLHAVGDSVSAAGPSLPARGPRSVPP